MGIKKPGYVLDTNIFDLFLDFNIEVQDLLNYLFNDRVSYDLYASYIQYEEIKKIPEPKKDRRKKLLAVFMQLELNMIPTAFCFDVPGAGWGQGKWMCEEDRKLFNVVKDKLEEKGKSNPTKMKRKKKDPVAYEINLINDVLIFFTAKKGKFTLITGDKDLSEVAEEYNVNCRLIKQVELKREFKILELGQK